MSQGTSQAFDIVVFASSAGGITALKQVLSSLPSDFPLMVVVVQHMAKDRPSVLPAMLQQVCPLRVQAAQQGVSLKPGMVYVALPNWHLRVNEQGDFALTHTELVNFVRPAADLLFQSVATHYGERAIAVVLSGMGHDGALGLDAIKAAGGVTVAQSEATSEYFGMPGSAINTGMVDYITPLDDIAGCLINLVQGRDVPSSEPVG